jgi:hypothetical protein
MPSYTYDDENVLTSMIQILKDDLRRHTLIPVRQLPWIGGQYMS